MARSAYLAGDPALSRAVHAKRVGGNGSGNGNGSGSSLASNGHGETAAAAAQVEEGHNASGELVKSVVFGGLDGILASFAVVTGATGGGLSPAAILVLGFSGAVAEGLAMGLGDALSARAERDLVLHERNREFWEYDSYKEGEIAEMVELYVGKGMSRPDAEEVVGLMSDHRGFFVDLMTVEELGLQLPDPDDNPWKDGLVTFTSFFVFGSLPLLGYAFVPALEPGLTPHQLLVIACVVTGAALFALGAVKSYFSPKSWVRGGVEMLLVGGLVAMLAYWVGAWTAAYAAQFDPSVAGSASASSAASAQAPQTQAGTPGVGKH